MPSEEELLTRQMPHSTEAEQSVLGSMLIDARCVPEVIEALRPEDFYLRTNREIYLPHHRPGDGAGAHEAERGV